jgi:hypothetical protein
LGKDDIGNPMPAEHMNATIKILVLPAANTSDLGLGSGNWLPILATIGRNINAPTVWLLYTSI